MSSPRRGGRKFTGPELSHTLAILRPGTQRHRQRLGGRHPEQHHTQARQKGAELRPAAAPELGVEP